MKISLGLILYVLVDLSSALSLTVVFLELLGFSRITGGLFQCGNSLTFQLPLEDQMS